MKKTLALFVFLFALCFSVSAQGKYLFDTSIVDRTTKLIGRYPQYDKQKTYKEFNFIITDPKTIKSIILKMPLGKEVENVIEDPEFRISLVTNYDEVQSWIVNPNLKTVMFNGHSYEFDIRLLKALAKQYPFDYTFEIVPFKSKLDYEQYLEGQKAKSSFLFDYAPQFKYEGSFDIQFPRNSKFSSPRAISEYLTPYIEKIVSKNTYRITYTLNDKNQNDQTQFTMTITGSKQLFDKLQLDNLKKENWKISEEEGWFFYRSK